MYRHYNLRILYLKRALKLGSKNKTGGIITKFSSLLLKDYCHTVEDSLQLAAGIFKFFSPMVHFLRIKKGGA